MTRITELLDSKESLRVMALLPLKSNTAIEDLSLFERFSLICENLYLLKNNLLGKGFLQVLNTELDLTISFDISLDREAQKRIWRALCTGDRSDPSATFEADVNNINYTVSDLDLDNSVDVVNCILSSKGKDLEQFIDGFACCDQSAAFVDVSSCAYVRPDPYHADVAYQRVQKGDFSQEDIALLVAWVLCKVLAKRNLDIYIKVKDNVDDGLELLELLHSRKIFSPICICVDPTEVSDVDKIAFKCFSSDISDISNIYFGILRKSDEAFIQSSYYFPLNRIRQRTT